MIVLLYQILLCSLSELFMILILEHLWGTNNVFEKNRNTSQRTFQQLLLILSLVVQRNQNSRWISSAWIEIESDTIRSVWCCYLRERHDSLHLILHCCYGRETTQFAPSFGLHCIALLLWKRHDSLPWIDSGLARMNNCFESFGCRSGDRLARW